VVHIGNCVIRKGGEIPGPNYYGEQIEISVYETKPGEELWNDEPEKVGALSTEFMTLYLPADVPHVSGPDNLNWRKGWDSNPR
jgi:hypothetical protein